MTMFTVSARAKRLCAAFAAGVAAIPLGSLSPVPVDPSLLAAPKYEPELWNDISNENLALFYTRHKRFVEAYVADNVKNPGVQFRRNAHSSSEKALTVIRSLYGAMNAPDYKLTDIVAWYAYAYKLPNYEVSTALYDVKEMYRPRGFQEVNNCLAYSVNDRDRGDPAKDRLPAAGERTLGEAAAAVDPYKSANYAAMIRQTIRGNVSDGMIFTGQKMESRPGFYRVAFYMRPIARDVTEPVEAIDYHYVRQDSNGFWSHKFGALNVTDIDYSGKKIIDPQKADMAAYRFIGYFLVPQGGLDVGAPEEKATKPGTRPAFGSAKTVVPTPARP